MFWRAAYRLYIFVPMRAMATVTMVMPMYVMKGRCFASTTCLTLILNTMFVPSALLHALEEGRLGGAALDVFASEKAPVQDHVVAMCR